MGDKENAGTPLEFYLWRRGNKTSPKLSSEKTVQGRDGEDNLIGDALRIFNSRSRTVRRSSGGLSVAEPYQIVFLEQTEPNTHKPEVRIKVRFKDFKMTRTGEISTGELVTHTKVVAPSELGEAFSWDLAKAQTFVADFGQGIIPVHIVEIASEPTGGSTAYFIETADLTRLIGRDAGTVPVQVYKVDRDVLRSAETKRSQGRKSEWDVARENYAHLKSRGATVIPPALACGGPIALTTGKTPQEVRTVIEKVLNRHSETEAAYTARRIDTGSMVPFGVFE